MLRLGTQLCGQAVRSSLVARVPTAAPRAFLGTASAPSARGAAGVWGAVGAAGAALAGWALYENRAECIDSKTYETYWPRKIMILFGKPGAGKGTCGPKIEAKLEIPQLSTGDMLRAAVSAKTPVGLKAKAAMDSGALVTDEIVFGIIEERIKAKDCQNGFILDGMPRTLKQAQMLDALLARGGERVSNVLCLDVPDSVLEARITGRWIHKASGRSYHVSNAPPKSLKKGQTPKEGKGGNMLDDVTGEPLMQRKDDTSEALKTRLKAFHDQTTPVLEHYKPLGIVKIVDANQSIDKVTKDVFAALEK